MFCVGKNDYGQLGDGSYNDSEDWVTPILPSGRSVVDISSNYAHYITCAVLDDGSVWCWGAGSVQQGGLGPRHSDANEPVLIAPSDINAIAVESQGLGGGCVLSENGSVSCWGQHTRFYFHPERDSTGHDLVQLPNLTSTNPAVQIGVGMYHACALLESGDVTCWGRPGSGSAAVLAGQAWDNRFTDPGQIIPGLSNVTIQSLIVSAQHTCVLTTESEVLCWGKGTAIGDGTTADAYTPSALVGGSPNASIQSLHGTYYGSCVHDIYNITTCSGSLANGAEQGNRSGSMSRSVTGLRTPQRPRSRKERKFPFGFGRMRCSNTNAPPSPSAQNSLLAW